jgi:signal transduction histidine kinase
MAFGFRPSSLIFKVISITSLVLIIAISFNSWLDMKLHEAHIRALTHEKAKIISEFIENIVIRAMVEGKHLEIQRILKNFTVYKGIWKISLSRPDGIIRASTNDEELNRSIGDTQFYLQNQHFVREEMVSHEDGTKEKERIFYFNNPILNHPECFGCHNAKEKVVGLLTVANSLKEMDEQMATVKKDSVILSVITIGSLSSVLGLLFLRLVNIPITKLTGVMRRVEKGELGVRAELESKDEMGMLAENLNLMIAKLDAAKREAEQYHRQLIQRADRMASIGELASGMAHEIRNPLAGIQGAIQVLADGFPMEDGRRQVTDEIQKQIFKLERLVKDMLSYAKPVPANYLPADINELLEKVLSFFLTQGGMTERFKIEKNFFLPCRRFCSTPIPWNRPF